MNYNKFDENQWTFDLPDQAEENTASSDNSDSGLKQVAENTSVPNRSGSGYEKGKNGSNKRVSRYKSPGASRAAASGSGGNSGEEAKKKRTLFNALVSAVCIAAIILGTGLATGVLWPGKKYTVTVENGSGSGEYRPGDDVTIQADPAKDGYTFIGWSVSDENVISSRYRDRDRLIFEMPAEDFTVTAEYTETQYTLTVENGMIEDAGNSGSFTEGTKIDIRADSKDGHTFIKWEVTEGNATFNDASFQEAVVTIGSEDTVIQAVYTENKYTLSIKGGTLEGDKTSGSFTEGTKITVCADSKDGYTFNKWEVTEGNATFNDVSSQDAEVTIGSEDAVIQAVYTEDKYTLSIKGGTIEGGKTSGSFTEGTKIDIRADSKDGYEFTGWVSEKGDAKITDKTSPITRIVTGRQASEITAKYEKKEYTVTVNGGSIVGGDRERSFKKGETVTIVANVKKGYYFSNWKVEKGNVKIHDITAEQASFVSVETDVVITAVTKASPVLRPGWEINDAFRELAGTTQAVHDDKIKAVVYTDETPPPGAETAELAESGDPVTAWFDKGIGTIFIYTTANKVLLNKYSGSFMYNLHALEKVNLWKYDTSSVTSMTFMFCGCDNLTNLDLDSFDTSSVTDMEYMFSGCENLTNLDLDSFDTSSVTDMEYMFYGCENLTNLDLSSFDTSSVTNMWGMFWGCENLTNLDLSSFDTSSVTKMCSMFSGCENLTNLDLSSFDTSSVTNMGNMFFSCGLTELDLSSFDTSSVTSMRCMFYNCENLTNLDLSSFGTSSVTDMWGMFHGCENLTNLDLSSFDTSSVTSMGSMFSDCENLTNLDLSSFDTSSVTSMRGMFFSCGLRELDLSNFDTSSVTDMSYMFWGCNNLTNLDTSNFDMSSVIKKDHMFD